MPLTLEQSVGVAPEWGGDVLRARPAPKPQSQPIRPSQPEKPCLKRLGGDNRRVQCPKRIGWGVNLTASHHHARFV